VRRLHRRAPHLRDATTRGDSMHNKNPMKHVWMIENIAASGAREAKSIWTKIGIAVANLDGSLTLTLAAIPVSGRMIVRDATPVLGAPKDGVH
jgi:hypothetical protein